MYLNCHSFHSLRYGTIPLNELIAQALANKVTALALTDINTVTGIYELIKFFTDIRNKLDDIAKKRARIGADYDKSLSEEQKAELLYMEAAIQTKPLAGIEFRIISKALPCPLLPLILKM
jgi:DNA polymerase III alpha subunit